LGTLGGQVSQETEFLVQLFDTVGQARTICSSEDGLGYPDANLFGPIDSPSSGVPSHPRMLPVKLSKCSDGLFVFKYTVKTTGLCVLPLLLLLLFPMMMLLLLLLPMMMMLLLLLMMTMMLLLLLNV
jgi:hypothetical protein